MSKEHDKATVGEKAARRHRQRHPVAEPAPVTMTVQPLQRRLHQDFERRQAEAQAHERAQVALRAAHGETPESPPDRKFVLRATIEDDPAHDIVGGEASILLDAIGGARPPEWMLGPRVRALLVGVYKLRDHHNADYLVLLRYYVHKDAEKEIAKILDMTPYRVHDALRFCIGYLHGCLDTDGEHARLRGVTPDMLYENYVDTELDRLFDASGTVDESATPLDCG